MTVHLLQLMSLTEFRPSRSEFELAPTSLCPFLDLRRCFFEEGARRMRSSPPEISR